MFPANDRRGPASARPARGKSEHGLAASFPRVRFGRALLVAFGGVTILIGCPLYSDDCDGQRDCASGFYCESFSRRCQPLLDEVGCSRPEQCELGETCTPDFVCRPGSCGYHGCVTGYRCGVVDSAHTCVAIALDAGPADASVPMSSDPDASTDFGDAGLDAGAGDASVDAGEAP
jgi:hypothetical protein